MHDLIDLRSDTVTLPTPSMRRAMAEAVVGDDVYGEDPTVRSLEDVGAALFERKAALYVPSGTMGNQIAVHLLAEPGTEVIGEAKCHIFNFEMGGIGALTGAMARPVAGKNGILAAADIEGAIQPRVGYATPTSLVTLENTHNLAGGRITPPETLTELTAVARRHHLPVHLDGARIFNAAAALGCPPAELAAGCDTLMVCLSKGLAAPVGSLLIGDLEAIEEARRIRKLFGGGMRQAGIIAAAGLVALDEMAPRLGDDNRRAKVLAEGLAELPEIDLDPDLVDTNIVFFGLHPESELSAIDLKQRLEERGVLVHTLGGDSIRMVTHYHIGDLEISRALNAVREGLET